MAHVNNSFGVGRIDGDNIVIHESWWNQLPLLCGFLILTALMTYITLRFPEFLILPITIGNIKFEFNFLLLIPLVLLAKATFRVYNNRFVLTPEYLIHVTGRITWRSRSVRLEYRLIQEIEIDQTILQRILGLGDLIIIPIAGTVQTTVHMNGIYSPKRVKDAIRRFSSIARES